MPSVTDLGYLGTQELQTFNSAVNSNNNFSKLSDDEITTKTQDLLNKEQVQLNQLTEIADKEKLLLTRARMLQIVQDRNQYKKKIIYSLIAAIFAIFIFTIVMYVLFVRKISMIKNK